MSDPTPNPYCPDCNGTGTIYEWTAYGDTEVRWPVGCWCLTELEPVVEDEEQGDE